MPPSARRRPKANALSPIRLNRPGSYQNILTSSGASTRFLADHAGLIADLQRAKRAARKGGPVEDILLRINQRSVERLQDFAVEAFEQASAANGHRPDTRSGALIAAIRNPDNHKVTPTYFSYFIGDRVFRTVRYWRAIEIGSRASVGRLIPLRFIRDGAGFHPKARRGPVLPGKPPRLKDRPERPPVRPGALRTDPPDNEYTRSRPSRFNPGPDPNRPRGKRTTKSRLKKGLSYAPNDPRREPGVLFVRVQRPIKAYRYNRTAIARFNQGRVWYTYIRSAQKEIQALGLPLKVK